MPSPPLPHSLLNKRIPVTICVNSINCRSLSRLDKLRKFPNSVCGKTLCKAAVASRTTDISKLKILLTFFYDKNTKCKFYQLVNPILIEVKHWKLFFDRVIQVHLYSMLDYRLFHVELVVDVFL